MGFAFQVDTVFDDEDHRLGLDGVLFHDGEILFEFARGDHLLRHERLHRLVEIGIFFRPDLFRFTLAVIGREVFHAERLDRNDLQ